MSTAVDINYDGAPRHADGSIKVHHDHRQPVCCLVCGQRFIPGPDDPIGRAYEVTTCPWTGKVLDIYGYGPMRGICAQHRLGTYGRMSMDHAMKTFRKDGVACMNALRDAAKHIREG
jgi:hypothetical protein